METRLNGGSATICENVNRGRDSEQPRNRRKPKSQLHRPNQFENMIMTLPIKKRLAVLSIVAFTVMPGTGCGRYRQHVYRERLTGHYAAYTRDRRQPPTADTLDLNENGSCVHRFLKSGEKNQTEESCTWALIERLDGSWLRFEDLSDGIHRKCTGICVVEAAAFDGEFVTRFELPSTPDVFYAK
jgi:hypothetical protein